MPSVRRHDSGFNGFTFWTATSIKHRHCASSTTDASGIILDGSAVERLQEVFKSTPDQVLRVKVDPGGCSGFQYVFTIEESAQSDDIILKQDGVHVVVDKVSVELLRGSTIEFTEDLISSNFQVTANPNAEQGCGCGASFAVKMD